MAARLPRSFYARSALRVAPDLLGQMLVRALPGRLRLAARIVEAEAYTTSTVTITVAKDQSAQG